MVILHHVSLRHHERKQLLLAVTPGHSPKSMNPHYNRSYHLNGIPCS